MIEVFLAEYFNKRQWFWNLKGRGRVVPTEADFEAALDEAARQLLKEPVGSRLSVGRLIIEKKHNGHDVYVYVGEYF